MLHAVSNTEWPERWLRGRQANDAIPALRTFPTGRQLRSPLLPTVLIHRQERLRPSSHVVDRSSPPKSLTRAFGLPWQDDAHQTILLEFLH